MGDILENTKTAVACTHIAEDTREAQIRAFWGSIMPNLSQDEVETMINHSDKSSSYDLQEKILLKVRRAYECLELSSILKTRIAIVKQKNNDLIPDIDDQYWCETCGSHSHQCHPISGYCFHCDTDNWEPENWLNIL